MSLLDLQDLKAPTKGGKSSKHGGGFGGLFGGSHISLLLC